jgi:hypothetical protein
MDPSWVDPVTVKCVVSIPMVDKGLISVTVLGFHKIANPSDAPAESECMKSHPRQLRWKMVYASTLAHFVSCSRRTSGFST